MLQGCSSYCVAEYCVMAMCIVSMTRLLGAAVYAIQTSVQMQSWHDQYCATLNENQNRLVISRSSNTQATCLHASFTPTQLCGPKPKGM